MSCVINNHHYTSNSSQTCADTLHAGMDIDCGEYLPLNLPGALSDGAVLESDLDVALTHLFMVRFRVGQFDPAEEQPYLTIPPSAANSQQVRQLLSFSSLHN